MIGDHHVETMPHVWSADGFTGGLRLQPGTAANTYDNRYQQSPSDTKSNITSYADDASHTYGHFYPRSTHGHAYPTRCRPD